MKKIILIILLMFVSIRREGGAKANNDQWLCDTLHQTVGSRSGHAAVWIGYPEGWSNMPDDLGETPIDLLPINEDVSSAYYLMFSPSTMQLWVFPFWTLNVSTDINGEHVGNHGLCDVMVYDLASRKK